MERQTSMRLNKLNYFVCFLLLLLRFYNISIDITNIILVFSNYHYYSFKIKISDRRDLFFNLIYVKFFPVEDNFIRLINFVILQNNVSTVFHTGTFPKAKKIKSFSDFCISNALANYFFPSTFFLTVYTVVRNEARGFSV